MKRYKLIANPAAGRGKARAAALRAAELFKARGAAFDLEFSSGPKQAAEIARAACREFDVIVVVGGDGTVNEIVPSLIHSGKPLGIIPSGSGNDFIKALGIPDDIEKSVEVVLAGDTATIDVGRINGTYFANAAGFGFDAAVNRASYGINHGKRGLWLYVCALVRTLGKYDPVRVRVSFNDEVLDEDLYLLTIGNGTTVGGGFKLTPRAKVDDGQLDVTIVKPLSIPMLLRHLPKVFFGTIDRASRYARLVRTSRLKVTGRSHLPVHVDGEIFEAENNEYTIEIVPRALMIIRGEARGPHWHGV